jgi:hypothetical protein
MSFPIKVPINALTSCLFIINSLYLSMKNDIVYRNSFILLTLSSLAFHTTKNTIIHKIDKIFVYNVVVQGGIRFFYYYKNSTFHSSLVIFNFLLTVYLYCYGYCYSKYSFDKDQQTAEFFHAFVHIFGSLGHLSIAYLIE